MTRAVVISGYGPPEVLQIGETEVGPPGPGQIRVAVRFAGVGPTDLAIRAGHLAAVFPAGPGAVLGFEAAGVVESAGPDVTDVTTGDEVAVFLPGLGGYAELAVADFWVRKPASVTWTDAAALPASGEAAARVLDQLAVGAGETLLLLGAAGSVGRIATQLAVARGVTVIAAVRPGDFAAARELGATPVDYATLGATPADAALGDRKVDAVFDASGRSDLPAAIALAGGPQRVITLADHRAHDLGVTLSNVVPEGVPAALNLVMSELAAGRLTLQPQTVAPLADAAAVHARLESGDLRTKVVLKI
ncbi:NADPH:quinone reductase-like Zn-dependent oxidoreductase [Actinoplanes tereljensis]|uniref:NADPH:quinone reductase n=1 Tax=Paractinoplanes tereljensis TaxID=571912 RepID=A0A919NMW8_9ACTN|nr:NADP-dependent oxidoreductase [Actinoplanes tereljensis]GIF21766.1 NADPH:quinone reductase [Actinoplanes tereljensis]